MTRFGLAPVTLFTLVMTALLLPGSGWFAGRSSARPPALADCRCQAKEHDMSSDAVRRYRSAQPTHWRAMMLHR